MSRIPMLVLTFLLFLGACSSSPLPDPAPPPGDVEPAPVPIRRMYIGDISRRVFHRDGCPELEQLDLSKRRLLENPGEAADEGYAPCKTCNPYRGW